MTRSSLGISETKSVEAVREFWDRRPCNIRHSQKSIGSREYFDEVEARKYFVEPHIPRFAEFERWAGKRVLEIGCGIGTDTIRFARNGAQVTAVDLSERSIEIARQRAGVFGLDDRIRFVTGNAEELSQLIPQQPYDLVYSFGVLHHTPHPERLLAEIRRFVDAGSIVKIMVYHKFSWKVLWILMTYGKGRAWRRDLVARFSEAQEGSPVTRVYSRRRFKKLLEESGFVVRRLEVEHIFPYRIPDYVEHRYVKTWYFRWMPAGWFHFLEHRLGWHLCVSAEPAVEGNGR